MKRVLLSIFTLFVSVGLFAQQLPVVAVASFEAGSGITAQDVNNITRVFFIRLGNTRRVNLVDRTVVDRVLREHNFQTGDWSDTSKTAEIGKALNANWIVRGELERWGTNILVTVQFYDIQSFQFMGGTDVRFPNTADPYDHINPLVENLVQTISGTPPVAVRPSTPAVTPTPVQTVPSTPAAQPAPNTEGDFEWRRDGNNIVITRYNGTARAVVIPDKIRNVPVTTIKQWAFMSKTSMTSITIPSTVTTIENSAFYGCTGLTSITIPSSVTYIMNNAFTGCTGLTSITIPSSVTSIGNRAFSDCSGLTSITIPSSVTSIGNNPFSGCIALTSINVDTQNANFISRDGIIFSKDMRTIIAYLPSKKESTYNIPSSVTSIGGDAFSYCTGLTSVTIPSSVTSIGNNAFSYCTGLTSITIPSSVSSIGSSAFVYCTGLTSITIPSSVTSIGGGAFYDCTGLTSITIPSSVTSIEGSLFWGCTGLTSITIPPSVTSIGAQAFRGCTKLTSISIPTSVTTIGGYAFCECTNLTNINADSQNPNFTSRDGVLFSKDMRSIILYPSGKKGETYTIPSSVTAIGEYAFEGNINLRNVTIPSSVTTIGDGAFANCTNLRNVSMSWSTSVGNQAFPPSTQITYRD